MIVTSVNNEYIKGLCKLKDKKYRDSTNLFLIEGEHLVNEAINEDLVKELVILEGCSFEYADKYADNITYVNENVMKKLSSMDSYPNIIGIAYKRKEDKIGSRVLVLEDIQDPGNLGTIVRTAEGAGVTGIIMNRETVDIYNPKVIRSTMGAIFRVPFVIADSLPEVIFQLKQNGVSVYAGHLKGDVFYKQDYRDGSAFLIGNEGNGLTDEITALADHKIKIPMKGKVESLNAAVSATILMYETMRQREFM